MPHLFVFDLDGTLIDSRRDLAESANEVLATYGAPALSVNAVSDMVGEGARVLVERVLKARDVERPTDEALERFLGIYERRLTNHTRPYPGVIETLDALEPRATLAVLTNKPTRHTHLLLEALELSHYFIAALGLDGPFPRKPDPAGLRYLVKLAGATPEDTMMVGDSPIDAETARRAGTRLCVLRYGYGQFEPGSTFPPGTIELNEPRELEAALLAVIT